MDEVRADFARWPGYQKRRRTWRISPLYSHKGDRGGRPGDDSGGPGRPTRMRPLRGGLRLAAGGEADLQQLYRALRQRETVDALVLGDKTHHKVGGGAGG